MAKLDLSRPLLLEQRMLEADGAGGLEETWIVRGTLWADMRPRSATETAGEETSLSRALWTITVRAAPFGAPSRPVEGNRFREGRRRFSVIAVQESDPTACWLRCIAEEERAP